MELKKEMSDLKAELEKAQKANKKLTKKLKKQSNGENEKHKNVVLSPMMSSLDATQLTSFGLSSKGGINSNNTSRKENISNTVNSANIKGSDKA